MNKRIQVPTKIIEFGGKAAFFEYETEVTLKHLGLKREKFRYYLPIDYTKLPIIEIANELLSSYGYSDEQIQHIKKMATFSLVKKAFTSLKSGKNKLDQRSYRKFDPNQLLFSRTFHTDIVEYENERQRRKVITELSDEAKTEKLSRTINNLKSQFKVSFKGELIDLLEAAIYPKSEECDCTNTHYQSFREEKLQILSQLTDNFTVDISTDSELEELLKKIKKELLNDVVDKIQSIELKNITDESTRLLSKDKDSSNDVSELTKEIDSLLAKLKSFLNEIQSKKIRGLKEKVSDWQSKITEFTKIDDLSKDEALYWIKNTFGPTLPVYQKLSRESDQNYNLIFRLFMKECLRQISKNENLNKYERRLFIVFFISTPGLNYHIPMFEPFFMNYYNFSPKIEWLTWNCTIFSNRQIKGIPINYYAFKEFVFFLKFFPIWLETIKEEEKLKKRKKRKKI